MKKAEKYNFEKLYSKPNQAPWSTKAIPKELKSLVDKLPPKANILDVGCGEGYFSIFFAKKGFKVTAIDSSPNAIKLAKVHAKEAGVKCKFLILDYRNLTKLNKKFDFVFDWRFLLQILRKSDRQKYLSNVKNLLTKEGLYLSLSFSRNSSLWGKGNIRISPIGTRVSFLSLEEQKRLFSKHFQILKSEEINVSQKPSFKIKSNYILSRKKA